MTAIAISLSCLSMVLTGVQLFYVRRIRRRYRVANQWRSEPRGELQ